MIICAYTEDRWEALRSATASVQRQTRGVLETIVVIDHNPRLFDRARLGLHGVCVIENDGERGLSAARNSGVSIALGNIVAFLDDDAIADDRWLEELIGAYDDPCVVGAGGLVRPRWGAGAPPEWLPREFYWTVGCSYRGLPKRTVPVRNPIGAAMSFRRAVFARIGGFRTGIGRIGRTPLGCEETEFSIRARQANPASLVLHVPDACVDHLVPLERTTWSYFRSRCWGEGLSKAMVARTVGSGDGLATEWTYTLIALPTGAMQGLLDAARGDIYGLLRTAAIVLGLMITTAGYLYGRMGNAA